MKNILITGVAGFIPSHLTCYLVKKYPDYFFLGIDKISYCSSVKNFEEINNYDNFQFVKADFTKMDFMDFLFDKYNIDTVIHMGADTDVSRSFQNGIDFSINNIISTQVLLEVSKKYNVKKFILVSTDEVYGSKDVKSDENSRTDATNMYSSSKLAAEEIARSYIHSFKMPIIITRGNNVYGSKQYHEKVVPKFILKMIKNEALTIQGSGKQKRSFLYVDDVCKAFDVILHSGIIGEIYNIGCEYEYSILDLAEKLIQYFGKGEIIFIKDRIFNDQRYFISTEKLEKLGWKPETLFDEGLKKTIQWYINNPSYFE